MSESKDIHYKKRRLKTALEKGFDRFGNDKELVEGLITELKLEDLGIGYKGVGQGVKMIGR